MECPDDVSVVVSDVLSGVEMLIDQSVSSAMACASATSSLREFTERSIFEQIPSVDPCLDSYDNALPVMPLPVVHDCWCLLGTTSRDVMSVFPHHSASSLASTKSARLTSNKSVSQASLAQLQKPGTAISNSTKATSSPARRSSANSRLREGTGDDATKQGPRVRALDPLLPPKQVKEWEDPVRKVIAGKLAEARIRESALQAAVEAQERQADDRQRIGAPKDTRALTGKASGVGATHSRPRKPSLFTDSDGVTIWPSAPSIRGAEFRCVSPTAKASSGAVSKGAPKKAETRSGAPKSVAGTGRGPIVSGALPLASASDVLQASPLNRTSAVLGASVDAATFAKSQSAQPPLSSIVTMKPGGRLAENGQVLYGGDPPKVSLMSGSSVMTVSEFARQAAAVNPKRAA